jgi:hypothetical protein
MEVQMEARQSRLLAVRQVKRQVEQRLLHRANVVGVGVGYKHSHGAATHELAVVVSVAEKMPLADLPAADRVPRSIGGVTTDVVETGELRALATLLAVPPRLDAFAPLAAMVIDPTARLRPARPGISIGHSLVTAGTLGCLVRRGGDVFVLSNNHVLANSNNAHIGDAIWQPGRVDGGTPDDQLGNLAGFVPLAFEGEAVPPPPGGGEGCAPVLGLLAGLLGQLQLSPAAALPHNAPGHNQVDCALARPTTPDLVNPDILGIGVPAGVGHATLGTQVQKSGRTTGHTRGTILQVDVTASINYGEHMAVFTNQLMAGAMSQGGDSGSLVLDLHSQAVGLLFAGSPATTLINPIELVLDALGVEIVTSA